MIAHAGLWLLGLSATAALFLTLLPITEKHYPQQQISRWQNTLAVTHFLSLACALAMLIQAMATLNFSLEYVVDHTSVRVPMLYRVTGTWGGHEGSLLLWTTIVAGWMLLFLWKSQDHDKSRLSLSFIAAISLGFHCLLWLSSPFVAIEGSIPADGNGLNPMLQDIGLALHPPILYIGYGGIIAICSQIMAALWLRQPIDKWLHSVHQMTMSTWGWLTLGIALGCWWAYMELGWGGWWFWDPTENGSLMPWLTLTALLHANLLSRKGIRAGHAITTLAITSLGLMLVGMFIVRSGVMASVHSFTRSPALGTTILAFTLLSTGIGFLIQVLRPPVERVSQKRLSRTDIGLIASIIIFVMACATVLLGTLYPIVLDVLNLGKISVGAAYFNTFFVPMTLAAALLLALCDKTLNLKALTALLTLSLALGCAASLGVLGEASFLSISSLSIASLVTVNEVRKFTLFGFRSATLAHIGLAVAIAGSTLSDLGLESMDLRMAPYQRAQLGDLQFRFTGTTPVIGPNYLSDLGFFDVSDSSRAITEIRPEKRLYPYFGQVMTEVGNQPGLSRDIYIALGEPFDDGSWAVRLKIIPFISLLWIGALLMVIGGWANLLIRPLLSRRKPTNSNPVGKGFSTTALSKNTAVTLNTTNISHWEK
ncbi:cytochrome c-type biogenesis CcmF C-terminal domain-containing protein [Parendozoicomonas sp. Alg238-R29]|uniref:heme lyase CcmF/NrfE family subunit n=1 Tax=Parendozoicomonas sp. Alg238-R29 TaxID=2993446 RepID=UPI00248F1AEC|nr:cytochrome c-type biogenesis CcmF C-terminal domain-containing protein [Parendozoicomonas sp. Alg238-R29]